MIIVIHQHNSRFFSVQYKDEKKNKQKHTSTFLYLNQYGVALYCKTVQLFPPPPVLPRFPHVFLAFSREVVSKKTVYLGSTPYFSGQRQTTYYLIIRKT